MPDGGLRPQILETEVGCSKLYMFGVPGVYKLALTCDKYYIEYSFVDNHDQRRVS